jgi:hypothetical protein
MNTHAINAISSISEYLSQLRQALGNADAAVIQDALYDAEDYLRAAVAESGQEEAAVIDQLQQSYGTPIEVAATYLKQESHVSKAIQLPKTAINTTIKKPDAQSLWRRFFNVATETKTYGALAYLLLSLPLGVFYFTWATTGISLSFGLLLLIIGIPFIVFFMATVWALALVEGRLIETLLGERMPRRPMYQAKAGFWEKVKDILSDARTYSTLLYLLISLPLGTAYFTVIISFLSTSLALVFGSTASLFGFDLVQVMHVRLVEQLWLAPLLIALGVLLFFITLHLARLLGYMHAQIAKLLLVKAGAE